MDDKTRETETSIETTTARLQIKKDEITASLHDARRYSRGTIGPESHVQGQLTH